MLLTITLILSSLVTLNLLLLKFSCNKTTKHLKSGKKPVVLKPQIHQLEKEKEPQLAPTGS